MENYSSTIISASRDLTLREKIRVMDGQSTTPIDKMLEDEQSFELDYDAHVLLQVHNPHAKGNTDYVQCVVIATNGEMYRTGSQSFIRSLEQIIELVKNEGYTDTITLEVFTRPSKNYSGGYITCTLA